jgi:hypothetical protein
VEADPQLAALFTEHVQVQPIKRRPHEISYMLARMAELYGVDDFGDEERSYIEQHTLSLRYSQFVFMLERICERTREQGGTRVRLGVIHQLVSSSKKMLAYEQLINHRYFARIVSEARILGIREAMQLVEAAVIAQTLHDTFNCYAHTARVLQLPVTTLSSRQRVLAPHIEVFNRVLSR